MSPQVEAMWNKACAIQEELDEERVTTQQLSAELDGLKSDLSRALERLEFAQSMGWPDRAAEAIGQIGELV